MLREVSRARSPPACADDDALARAYDDAAAGLRLDGRCPPGCSARRSRAATSTCSDAWREGLRRRSRAEPPARAGADLAGPAPEHRRDVDLAPALPSVGAAGGGRHAMAFNGGPSPSCSRLASDRGDPHAAVSTTTISTDLLRGWLTHLALPAAGIGAGAKSNVAVAPARVPAGPPPNIEQVCFSRRSRPPRPGLCSASSPRSCSAACSLLLPCEGMFTWWAPGQGQRAERARGRAAGARR